MSEDTKTVQLDDVKAFLEEGKFEQLELDAEQLQPVLEASEEATEEDEPISLPLREELEPDADTQINRAVWAMDLPGSVKVEVSPMDKNLFLKAALNDTPIQLSVTLPSLPDTSIVCRSLSDKENAVVFAALDADLLDKTVTSDGAFRSHLQAYSTYLQVEKMDNKPYKYHTTIPDGMDIQEAAKSLREHHAKVQESVHVPQFSLALSALRVFTVKVKLCTDNLLNENFWKPLEADSE